MECGGSCETQEPAHWLNLILGLNTPASNFGNGRDGLTGPVGVL